MADNGTVKQGPERKLAKDELSGEQVRVAAALKDTFLRAVSHDLRSPLASILGFSMTLQRQPDMPQAQREEIIERIVNGAERMDRLITDLLDLDRLSQGIAELEVEEVRLKSMVTAVVDQTDTGDRPVTINVEDVEIQADGSKLERILENLISNAARHTRSGTPIEVSASKGEEGVLIEVSDSGGGVDDEFKESIFQPFERGSVSPRTPGTGIGLYLVSEFARLHGGRAWVEDRPGGGSRFRVFLPAVA